MDLEAFPDWAKAAMVLVVGIVLAGVADFLLSQAGYGTLGMYVWAIGYGGAVLAVWLIWLRHLEFTPT